MSGKVVNLNHARKTRDKTAEKARADENAARFGRTKSDKQAENARDTKARQLLDGHEIE